MTDLLRTCIKYVSDQYRRSTIPEAAGKPCNQNLYDMAKKLNMQFSGTIGPLVGCLRYGQYHYRGKSKKYTQTAATVASAGKFGLAAIACKVMRIHLDPCLPNPKDQDMRLRLEYRIRQWLGQQASVPPPPVADIPFVNHFNFNAADRLSERLKISPVFSITGPNEAMLRLPGFVPLNQVNAPTGTSHLQLTICSVALRLNSHTCYGSSHTVISLPYNEVMQPAQEFKLVLETEPGNMLIAAMQLRFGVQENTEINYRKHEKKTVAAITGAMYI